MDKTIENSIKNIFNSDKNGHCCKITRGPTSKDDSSSDSSEGDITEMDSDASVSSSVCHQT